MLRCLGKNESITSAHLRAKVNTTASARPPTTTVTLQTRLAPAIEGADKVRRSEKRTAVLVLSHLLFIRVSVKECLSTLLRNTTRSRFKGT